MTDDTTTICPIPGPGQCVRERRISWDEGHEEGVGDGYETCDPIDATATPNLDSPCVISFEEDYD